MRFAKSVKTRLLEVSLNYCILYSFLKPLELIYHCIVNTMKIDMNDCYEIECTYMASGFRLLSLQALSIYFVT